jgi:hypothetical protein
MSQIETPVTRTLPPAVDPKPYDDPREAPVAATVARPDGPFFSVRGELDRLAAVRLAQGAR